MADLKGTEFRARVELTAKDGAVVAAVGEICARVPPASLGWLLEQRLIEPIAVIDEAAWIDLGRPDDGKAR